MEEKVILGIDSTHKAHKRVLVYFRSKGKIKVNTRFSTKIAGKKIVFKVLSSKVSKMVPDQLLYTAAVSTIKDNAFVRRLPESEFNGKVLMLEPKKPKPQSSNVDLWKMELACFKIPFVAEFVFDENSGRKFRFDLAILPYKIALEYEGISTGSDNDSKEENGHTSLLGYTSNCEKYNLAQMQGWIVLRYTIKSYQNCIRDVMRLIAIKKHEKQQGRI